MDANMMQAMMSDPELLALMSKPGMMEKLQAIMANPASAQNYANDPDVQQVVQKLSTMGLGGQAPQQPEMGGNDGVQLAERASSAGRVLHIDNSAIFNQILQGAKDKLVVVFFHAEWCGPCKRIEPRVDSMAQVYTNTTVFLSVDGDKNRGITMANGIKAFPTFQFFKQGSKVDEFSGADDAKLENTVVRYMPDAKPSTVKAPCPYKNFPLRETELIKFDTIKFELVKDKINDFNGLVGEEQKLNSKELRHVSTLIDTLDDRLYYLSSKITDPQFDTLDKLLQWPSKQLPPVLNILRIAMFHPQAARHFSHSSILQALIGIASRKDCTPVNALLLLQCLCNMFSKYDLTVYLCKQLEIVLSHFAVYATHSNKKLRVACMSLLMNCAYTLSSKRSEQDEQKEDVMGEEQVHAAKVQMLSVITEALMEEEDKGVGYRCLVILGTLIYRDEETKAVASAMEMDTLLQTMQSRADFDSSTNITSTLRELTMSFESQDVQV